MLKLYFGLTMATAVLDVIDFMIQLVRFGRKDDEYSDLVMVAASTLFLLLDFFYVCWIYQVQYKFPAYIKAHISQALFGFGGRMAGVLRDNMKKISGGLQRAATYVSQRRVQQ